MILSPWMDIIGAAFLAVAVGGIVPCITSFGGDQFEPYQKRMISVFFSLLYACVNLGGLIAIFILPTLRGN